MMMKKYLFPILTALLFFCGTDISKASHVAGGDITYEHIGGDSFLFTFSFYRDCDGINAPTTLATHLKCLETGSIFTSQIPNVSISFENEVSQLCDSVTSVCQGGQFEGMQRFTGQIIIDFSQFSVTECESWSIAFLENARNPTTNGLSSSGQNFFVTAELNNSVSNYENNSPIFTADPIPYVCAEQPVFYSFGVLEFDGDSIVYELDTALSNFNTNIPYVTGFSGAEPIPGITLNQATGQLQFIAPSIVTGVNNYIIAVTVREYRHGTGEYLGSVTRDIQLVVIDCPGNNVPVQSSALFNFIGSGYIVDSTTVAVCPGLDFGFDVVFTDFDTANNGTLSSDSIEVLSNISQILPGATFTETGGNPDTVSVYWNATNIPHQLVNFNFFVKDNACPVYGIGSMTFSVIMIPGMDLGPDTTICIEDSIRLNGGFGSTFGWYSISGDPLVVGQNISCDSCQRPWIKVTQQTTIVGFSDVAAQCGATDTIVIDVFDKFPVDITPVGPYCADDMLDTLEAETPGGDWFGPGITNSGQGYFNPGVLDPGFDNDTIVEIVYILSGVCENSSSRKIRVRGLPDARIETQGPFCVLSDTVQLEAAGDSGVWTGPNVTSTGILDPTAFTAPDTFMVQHTINDSGCVFTDSITYRVVDFYDSSIDSLPKLCIGDGQVVELNNYEADPSGIWSGDNVTEVPEGSGIYRFDSRGKGVGVYDITYTIEGDCGTTTTEELRIYSLPNADIYGADSVYCDNNMDSVILEPATPSGIWGGDIARLHDGWFVPGLVGEGLYKITYELYDTNTTCYNKEEVELRIAPTPAGPAVHTGSPYCQYSYVDDLRADGLRTNTYKWFRVSRDTLAKPESMEDSLVGWISEDTLVLDSVIIVRDSSIIGTGNPFTLGEIIDAENIFVTQTNEFNCESRTSRAIIEVLEAPKADFTAVNIASGSDVGLEDVTIVEGNVPFDVQFTNLTDTKGYTTSYYWTFGDEGFSEEEHPLYTYEDIGRFTVLLTASNAVCQDTQTLIIEADRTTEVFIPNVVTPNGDGANDVFVWEIKGVTPFEIVIYNRWGRKVFESADPKGSWDPSKHPDGVYYYVVSGTEDTLEKGEISYRGDITIFRN